MAPPWIAAVVVALAGGLAFHFAQRRFKARWDEIHTDIEAQLERGRA